MSSEYPSYCPVCGEDSENSSTSLGLSSKTDIFQCFLKLFSAEWRGNVFSFCEECMFQLSRIAELQRKLEEIQQRLKEEEKGLRNKLESSEIRFERMSLYSEDGRYFELRKQILGDKIFQPEPQQVDHLNRIQDSSQLEPPLVLVNVEKPEEDTELNHSGNVNDNDDEESSQSATIESAIPKSQPRPKRGRKRKLVTDTDWEEENKPKARPKVQKKRKVVRKPATKTKELKKAEVNEEIVPVEKRTRKSRKIKSPKIPKVKQQVSKEKKIITLHNIQLVQEPQYKCSLCDLMLPNKGHILRTHVLKYHTTVHECAHCSKRFGQASHLKRHMEVSHTTTTPQYPCPICARPFFSAYAVKGHVWSHYSKEDKAEALERGEKMPRQNLTKSFQCDQCPSSFSNRSDLNRHSKAKHRAGSREKQLCGICGVAVLDVDLHMKIKHTAYEDKKFECTICKLRFIQKNKLETHRKSAHSNDKPFNCDVCQKDFKFLQNLKDHQLKHEEVKPFKCQVCKKGFTRKAVMNRHVSSIHDGMKRSDYINKTKKKLNEDKNAVRNLGEWVSLNLS